MFDETTYASYKRDTRRLIHWVVNTSNKIIRQWSSDKAENLDVNTSGKITVSGLVRLAEIIERYVKEKNEEEKDGSVGTAVPGTVLKLIEKVLEARKAAHSFFEQIALQYPDPCISKSNATHKFFIDALQKTFEIFGGQEWVRRSRETTSQTASERPSRQLDPDMIEDDIVFSNQFSGLNLDNDDNDGDEDEEPNRPHPTKSTSSRQKKNKKGKKAKPGKKSPNNTPENTVSLDSCCIVDDDGNTSYDYLMAAYSLLFQMEEYRHYVQGLWREVAYGGYNSAIAATVSKIAISLVKQSEGNIFVDFPGQDAYYSILRTILKDVERNSLDRPMANASTSSDSGKAAGDITTAAYIANGTAEKNEVGNGIIAGCTRDDSHSNEIDSCTFSDSSADGTADKNEVERPGTTEGDAMDLKEHLCLYAYRDLLDFIDDFQKNCNGKPTKRMMKETRDWDPHFDLQKATKEQRLAWRRVYTINWLYDLVNVFINRCCLASEPLSKMAIGDIDWMADFRPDLLDMNFGLNDFALLLTSLATQKPNMDVRPRIGASMVLLLQFAVDSMTVCRGWTASSAKGHVLCPPASDFSSTRDIDLFLDRDDERNGCGYLHSTNNLVYHLGLDWLRYKHDVFKSRAQYVDYVRHWLSNNLGRLDDKYTEHGGQPLRFSNRNGVWEHSPFLCGSSLAQTLTAVYVEAMKDWETHPDLICIVHIHNMLVKRGYLSSGTGDLYKYMGAIFPTSFFRGPSDISSKDFSAALSFKIDPVFSSTGRLERRKTAVAVSRTSRDSKEVHDMRLHKVFKTVSFLKMYQDAEWNLSRIPDEDVPLFSNLFNVRLHLSKIHRDPRTGIVSMVDTILVQRARAAGLCDCEMVHAVYKADAWRPPPPSLPITASTDVPPTRTPLMAPEFSKYRLGFFLQQLEVDIQRDVSSFCNPISCFNPVSVLCMANNLWMNIEEKSEALGSTGFTRTPEGLLMYEQGRLSLTHKILRTCNEKALEAVAKCFEESEAYFANHIWWPVLCNLPLAQMKEDMDPMREIVGPACSVM